MSGDALGNPLRFPLPGGHRPDITQAPALIADVHFARLSAERAYDAGDFRQRIFTQEADAVIPSRKNRTAPSAYEAPR